MIQSTKYQLYQFNQCLGISAWYHYYLILVFINKTFNLKQDGRERTKRVARLSKGSSFGVTIVLDNYAIYI